MVLFCDRFTALVVNRGDLSIIKCFYYLLGCLQGDSLNVIKSIPIFEDTYALTWTTLAERFNKPRQLATLIVDKLLSTPNQSQELFEGLKEFVTLFFDHVSVLKTLNIPDLGSFLLFVISSRCLSLTTRKGFESTNIHDFSNLTDMVAYIKNWVALLEAVGSSHGFPWSAGVRPVIIQDETKSLVSRHSDRKPKVSFFTAESPNLPPLKCAFCSGEHSQAKCPNFVNLS